VVTGEHASIARTSESCNSAWLSREPGWTGRALDWLSSNSEPCFVGAVIVVLSLGHYFA
jgi:hypothetical protein